MKMSPKTNADLQKSRLESRNALIRDHLAVARTQRNQWNLSGLGAGLLPQAAESKPLPDGSRFQVL